MICIKFCLVLHSLTHIVDLLSATLAQERPTTTAYHLQTDGLVEHFNQTLTDMLAKSMEDADNWDERLPYVLFAYHTSLQHSTAEFLIFGRDAHLPIPEVLAPSRHEFQPYDYQSLCTCH